MNAARLVSASVLAPAHCRPERRAGAPPEYLRCRSAEDLNSDLLDYLAGWNRALRPEWKPSFALRDLLDPLRIETGARREAGRRSALHDRSSLRVRK